MSQVHDGARGSSRSRGWWLGLGAVIAVVFAVDALVSHSATDGLSLALLCALLAVFLPSAPSAARDPRWSTRGWRYWVLCLVLWLAYAGLEYALRRSLLIAIVRATLLIGSAMIVGALARSRRR